MEGPEIIEIKAEGFREVTFDTDDGQRLSIGGITVRAVRLALQDMDPESILTVFDSDGENTVLTEIAGLAEGIVAPGIVGMLTSRVVRQMEIADGDGH